MIRCNNRQGRRGGVIAWLAVCLVVILGILALGTDGGRMMEERRRVRAAADAAALAAARSWYTSINNSASTSSASSAAQQAALANASINGYSNDGTNSIVTVNIPPTSGPFQGRSAYFEVIVQSNLQGTFGQVFTRSALPVKGRAVARFKQAALGVVALSANGSPAFNVSGNATVNVLTGGVYVNSSSQSAYTVSNNASVTATTQQIVGNMVTSGNGQVNGHTSTGAAPVTDPLAALAAPSTSSYTTQSSSALSVTGNQALQPGIYTGGINISGNAIATLSPGVYIMNGGGFQVDGNSVVTGSGVALYNTGSTPGSISIAGNGNVTLSPPTSGPFAGISLFQDRTATTNVSIAGNGSLSLSGILYAPAAQISISGNGTVANTFGGFVASTITITGNGAVTVNTTVQPAAGTEMRLVE